MVVRHPDAGWKSVNDEMDRLQEVEHRAMLQAWAAEGHTEPLVLGSEDSHRLWEAVAAPPPSGQRICGLPSCRVSGDRLKTCVRCRAAHYCCREHQVEHYPQHKGECKRRARVAEAAAARDAAAAGGVGEAGGASAAAAAAGSSAGRAPQQQQGEEEVVSWRQLERLQGQPAQGKVLELRIVSEPVPFLRHIFEGKDRNGNIRRVACYADRPPPGLALGRVFRWRNPRFHWFMDCSSGARIEDDDLPDIAVACK